MNGSPYIDGDTYQAAKEEIRRAADIVEIIGEFVQLRRAGQSYMGLCPFHAEKAPSFTVSPSRQMFHCFGCKKGGDVFAFWMEYHRVSFPQALRDLAERYHIPLPERTSTPPHEEKQALRESLYALNEKAARFYHTILVRSQKGDLGRQYLKKRGITDDLIAEYQLGYASDEWNALAQMFRTKGLDMDMAVQAGLVIPRKKGGYYDRFRGRVLFPILNLRKQVLGFGARVLDDSLPKYLNTPETPVFQKGKTLYGIHAAFQAMRESNRVVIVEGYTDVLALKKHGFHGAVATLGTALTRDHIRMLKGYVHEAVVVFDSDTAGRTAAIRSLPHFLNEGLASKVVILPEDEDPDTYIHKHGLKGLEELLTKAVSMFDFFIDLKLSQAGEQIEHRVAAIKEIFPVLVELDNEAQRSLYMQRLAERSGVKETALTMELRKYLILQGRMGQKSGIGEEYPELQKNPIRDLDDRYMLNLLIHYPETAHQLMENDCRSLLSNPSVIEIFDVTAALVREKGSVSFEEIREKLVGEPAQALLRETELTPCIFPDHMVEQVLNGFKKSVYRLKAMDVKRNAKNKADLVELNKILAVKKNLENQVV